MRKKIILLSILACGAFTFGARAVDITEPVNNLVQSNISKWVADPALIEAIKAQNAKHAALTQADIDKMDGEWKAETSAAAKPMIDEVLGNSASAFLKKVKEENKGLFTEIFIMDSKGLNVGQSDVTSDYWQGDEAKFKESFNKGAGALFIDKVEQDESTQHLQSQVSMTIVDPATNQPIGAATIGIDVDLLTQ